MTTKKPAAAAKDMTTAAKGPTTSHVLQKNYSFMQDNIYLNFSLPHEKNKESLKVFKALLEQALAEVIQDIGE